MLVVYPNEIPIFITNRTQMCYPRAHPCGTLYVPKVSEYTDLCSNPHAPLFNVVFICFLEPYNCPVQ